jgi:hypothetical protein
MGKLFNPYEWIPKTEKKQRFCSIEKPKNTAVIESEIEEIICRIENFRIDLTENYADWLSIGFSLAAEFGENGRGYFHRVSKLHSAYDLYACNLQFDRCLRGQKGGISIKTFFYLAKSAGVNISIK